jgi:hypothetical protein
MTKQERYYSGMPARDPRQPLPNEVPPGLRSQFVKLAIGIALVGAGAILGLGLAPEGPKELQKRVYELEAMVKDRNDRLAEANRTLASQGITSSSSRGMLKAADKQRHEEFIRRYAASLRKAQAQPAAELIEWFAGRWNSLLDKPMPNDRITRRAEALSLLVGGMGKNLHPEDYVPWQAEFLAGQWLGELHFDLDGDGLPAKRTAANPYDSYADVSVCHVAMALNQAVTDARVLVMPAMRCDSPKARISVFLSGRTLDDALSELVKSLRLEGFLVVEKQDKAVRLILVGPGTRGG